MHRPLPRSSAHRPAQMCARHEYECSRPQTRDLRAARGLGVTVALPTAQEVIQYGSRPSTGSLALVVKHEAEPQRYPTQGCRRTDKSHAGGAPGCWFEQVALCGKRFPRNCRKEDRGSSLLLRRSLALPCRSGHVWSRARRAGSSASVWASAKSNMCNGTRKAQIPGPWVVDPSQASASRTSLRTIPRVELCERWGASSWDGYPASSLPPTRKTVW
jgi:hypothetical protein